MPATARAALLCLDLFGGVPNGVGALAGARHYSARAKSPAPPPRGCSASLAAATHKRAHSHRPGTHGTRPSPTQRTRCQTDQPDRPLTTQPYAPGTAPTTPRSRAHGLSPCPGRCSPPPPPPIGQPPGPPYYVLCYVYLKGNWTKIGGLLFYQLGILG